MSIIGGESHGVHLSGEYVISSNCETALGHVSNTISIASDAIERFVPLFGIVNEVMKSLYETYENAKYNKKMCAALIDRIEVAEQATRSLKRKKQENAENFSRQEYYRAWVRFTNVLKNIKNFAKDITQQSVFQKHFKANVVREAYDKNIKEFEDVCKDLQFSVYMITEEKREQENEQISKELNLLERAMSEVSEEVKNISQQINILSEQLSSQKLNPGEINVPYVKSSELTYPDTKTAKTSNVRGSGRTIIKRIYHKIYQVACKKIQAKNTESRSIQTQLVILGLLGRCPNIIIFYGLSKIDQIDYMVFEWAEHGSLKEVYENHSIPLTTKLQFISNIFKGLYFISDFEILHHDVRCANILVTENPVLDVKISNFELSRQIDGATTTHSCLNDYVRWLAPEKMRNTECRYNHKCEIFSFGMLVWELINEKIPYEKMSFKEVLEYVTNKKRENLSIQLNSDPILLELNKLIKQTWNDDPELRLSYSEILEIISNLEKNGLKNSPRIYPKKDTNNTITDLELNHQNHQSSVNASSRYDYDPKELPDWDDCPTFSIIEPIEDGIKAHVEKRHKEAWECFNEHADLGLSLAKYWKGYYLLKGFHGEIDIEKGLEWLRLAADDGITDAQFRYAKGLITHSGSSENYEIILKYMNEAADGGSEDALQNLGIIYLRGKFGVEKDEKRANEFFKLAALKNPKFAKLYTSAIYVITLIKSSLFLNLKI
ncbi:hypothetical protein Glove_97g77 [Diversispora epigaea]|uniref:Protein kinase domain-containing protein n=1 Tax=Diversispora epigaea TaxID=1348612 RepID=A0A397JFB7_9GLOM|nr:hypothetical protein Glove_97g77 [Diversispora epigaea]